LHPADAAGVRERSVQPFRGRCGEQVIAGAPDDAERDATASELRLDRRQRIRLERDAVAVELRLAPRGTDERTHVDVQQLRSDEPRIRVAAAAESRRPER